MEKVIYQKQPEIDYDSLVMVFHQGGKRYFSHSFIYHGRDGKYLQFFYKDPLPEGDFLKGWNYLDDHSFRIVMVPEPSQAVAIDDFIAAHNPISQINAIEIIEIGGFDEIDTLLKDPSIASQEIIFFGRK